MTVQHDPSRLCYVAHLKVLLERDPPRRKRERTRERLKLAAAQVLAEKGYLDLRALDVTEAAGMSEGSFYVYFKDKTDITEQVLRSFLEDFVQLDWHRGGSAFDAIRSANRRWISVCRANSGLMRCIFQFGDSVPEFARLVQRTNYEWHVRIAKSVVRHHSRKAPTIEGATLAAYLLGGMMDELVRKLVVYPDHELVSLTGKLDVDDDTLADIATLLWFRALYPGRPIPQDFGRADELLKASWPPSNKTM